MSKSVLLVSYYFAPQNVIGAVRPTKLAKYLTRLGYEVTVLCGHAPGVLDDPLLMRDLAGLQEVIPVRERSLFRWWKERGQIAPQPTALVDRAALPQTAMTDGAMQAAAQQAKAHNEASSAKQPTVAAPHRNGLRQIVLDRLYVWLFYRGDKAFARACTRKLLTMDRHFDVVFSCYGPLSVHTVARRAKRFRMADRWIADFRDEASVPFSWQRSWLKHYIRLIRKNADAITVVSEGIQGVMRLDAFGRSLPNGFDPEDAELATPVAVDRSMLNLSYCGQMYAGHSDLSPVFAAVRALADAGACEVERIRFHYAGRQGRMFTEQAAAYGLADRVTDHGMLPRTASLGLQQASDGLLMATWNTAERRGIITGKLMEYMMADKPVLCCVSGGVPESEARRLVDATHIGAGYEETSAEADMPMFRAYVWGLYRARFFGEPSPYAPDREAVSAFDYREIAARLADWMENV